MGCVKQPVVQAPVDIFISGKSDRAEPQPVVYTKPDTVIDWTIEIFDKSERKNWKFNDPIITDELVLVHNDDWECTAIKTKSISFYELVTVSCRDRNTWETVTTRPVGCGEFSRDSVDAEREKISISILCEMRQKF